MKNKIKNCSKCGTWDWTDGQVLFKFGHYKSDGSGYCKGEYGPLEDFVKNHSHIVGVLQKANNLIEDLAKYIGKTAPDGSTWDREGGLADQCDDIGFEIYKILKGGDT
jgi:hypothetical protein